MSEAQHRLQARIDEHLERGAVHKAIELLQWYLKLNKQDVKAWSRLAELARSAADAEAELLARFQLAELREEGTEHWLELAAAARSAGLDALVERAQARGGHGAAEPLQDSASDRPSGAGASEAEPEVEGGAAPDKLQERIDQYLAKGAIDKAIQLQQWHLEIDKRNAHGWERLAALARQAGRVELEFTARFRAAELLNVGQEERARLTDSARAAIVATRASKARARVEPPGGDEAQRAGVEEEEVTLVFLGRSRLPRPAGDGQPLADDEELITDAAWQPMAPDLGSEADPTQARFVCSGQPWPTVLDHHSLTFVGSAAEISAPVVELMETISLAEGAEIYSQGKQGQLLYCIDAGSAQISREREYVQEIGVVEAGSFFGEVGTIAGLPCTATAVAREPSTLRVLNRAKIKRAGALDARPLEIVAVELRSWYLEAALCLCPFLEACTDDERAMLTDGARLVTAKVGEVLLPRGGGSLMVIVVGVARVTLAVEDERQTVGFVSTGDLVGQLDPSPVVVVADSIVSAIELDRSRVVELSRPARDRLAHETATCEQVLRALGVEFPRSSAPASPD